MAKTKTIRVTEEELAALQALRNQEKAPVGEAEEKVEPSAAQKALADAFVSAIERTRPPEKKTIMTRKVKTPWSPPEGTPRTKMKRRYYQHGIAIGENVTNEDIELLNKLKPGSYCEGHVRVTLRRDRGIDIDYPVRTAAQRLRLVNQFGIRSFTELLQRVIDERSFPSKYRKADDADLYDID